MTISYFYPQDDAPDRSYRFTGIIWLDGQPEIRFALRAVSWEAARQLVEERWGKGHRYWLINEDTAHRPRGERS